MNKGLEMIEAKWLFNLKPEQIDVIVHPQSIIHSIVQFQDGSMKAQMGLPDMKLPIQFAMGYPNRLKSQFPRFDFLKFPNLTFEPPDMETFPCLKIAIEAMERGGNAPCVMNAANEIAVDAFLKKKIGFNQIPEVINSTLAKSPFIANPTFEDYVATDRESRALATQMTESNRNTTNFTPSNTNN
jgi:1-deoxy-D-xylulose-5-phosphate reductoisomerase